MAFIKNRFLFACKHSPASAQHLGSKAGGSASPAAQAAQTARAARSSSSSTPCTSRFGGEQLQRPFPTDGIPENADFFIRQSGKRLSISLECKIFKVSLEEAPTATTTYHVSRSALGKPSPGAERRPRAPGQRGMQLHVRTRLRSRTAPAPALPAAPSAHLQRGRSSALATAAQGSSKCFSKRSAMKSHPWLRCCYFCPKNEEHFPGVRSRRSPLCPRLRGRPLLLLPAHARRAPLPWSTCWHRGPDCHVSSSSVSAGFTSPRLNALHDPQLWLAAAGILTRELLIQGSPDISPLD